MINKVMPDEYEMYKSGMSIPEVHKETGIPLSTLRFRFKRAGILRSRSEGVKAAHKNGKIKYVGNSNPRSINTKNKMREAKLKLSDEKAIGFSFKPNGYMEFTKGPFKGRSVHCVVMEKIIGRKLHKNEIVHHKDGNRSNNHPDNLELKTRSKHARDHRLKDTHKRKRNDKGQFI